jgi:hypothetical protein
MSRLLCAAALALLLAPCLPVRAEDVFLGDFRLAIMDDPVRVEFQGGSAVPKPDDFQQAVKYAGAPRGWKIVSQADGRMELHNVVRGTHEMSIELSYDAAGYRIRYLKSADLMYAGRTADGTALRIIHKNYNGWIRGLVGDINAALQVKARTTVGFAPLDKVDAVPFLSEKGRGFYQEFLGMPTPRAFAIAPNGSWGRDSRPVNVRAAPYVMQNALERCNRRGAGLCRLYAVDEHVVWTAAGASAGERP